MKGDPVEWLTKQRKAGVDLREKGWKLQKQYPDKTDAWEERAEKWAHELRSGIAFWSPRDIGRAETLYKIPAEELPLDHPWHDSSVPRWPDMTSTGEGQPRNNPYNHHSGLVDLAEVILIEWRAAVPTQLETAQKPGRPPRAKTLAQYRTQWASELGWKANRPKAKEIAARDGYDLATVEREARRCFPK